MEWTFGQATLEGFLKGREQAQRRDEFRQKLMQEDRQESLLNMFRQKDYELAVQRENRTAEYQQNMLAETDRLRKVQEDANKRAEDKPFGVTEKGYYNSNGQWVPNTNLQETPMTENQKEEHALEAARIKLGWAQLANKEDSGQTEADTYGTLGLTIQRGKTKKMYPYTSVGTRTLLSDLTDPETANYVSKIIDSYKNNPQGSRLPNAEELQQQIAEHEQKGYRKFTDEQKQGLMDFLDQYYGNMKDKMQPSNSAIRIQ